ncbi:ABC transporter permease [Leptolyngbya sp. AN02str]|uniref:ABC transporter permease n=1 Tax=Leptolyngbya sp. AN02str TaxID=3423363 RepID=UPI003D316CB0
MIKYGREILAVARRILTELLRRQRSLIFWTVFPIILLVLNGYLLAESTNLNISDAEAYAIAVPASLVGAALFFSCLGGSVSTVVSEREQQTLKRLFISPLGGISYFLGIFLVHTYIGLGQALLIYTAAALMGAEFSGYPSLALLVIFLSIASYVGVGFVLGTQFARRTEDVNALVATFGVPLMILGGAFVPSTLFPELLLQLAAFNPIYHMVEALTIASGDRSEILDIIPHLQFLVGFAVAMVAAGWLSYRRMIRVERRL